MQHVPLAVLLSLVVVSPAYAQVGATTSECVARYGQPTVETCVFRDGPLTLTIQFDTRKVPPKATSIEFRKEGDHRERLGFSDEEIKRLLKVNGGEKVWKETPVFPHHDGQKVVYDARKKWETEDGELLATLGYDYLRITLKTW